MTILQEDKAAKLFHPAANIFPLMQGAEFDTLVKDIETSGRLEHSIVRHNGLILDGRNRYRACVLANVEPRFEDRDDITDPIAYVLRVNALRRHLTSAQKRALIAKVLVLDPTRSNKAIAAGLGVDDKTVAAVRSKLEANRGISAVGKRVGKDGRTRRVPEAEEASSSVEEEEAKPADAEAIEPAEEVNPAEAVEALREAPQPAAQVEDEAPQTAKPAAKGGRSKKSDAARSAPSGANDEQFETETRRLTREHIALTSEVNELKREVKRRDATIEERDATIEELRAEVARLRTELEARDKEMLDQIEAQTLDPDDAYLADWKDKRERDADDD